MNENQWKFIKKIINSLPKPQSRKALLFNKDWISFTEKILSINPYIKHTKNIGSIRPTDPLQTNESTDSKEPFKSNIYSSKPANGSSKFDDKTQSYAAEIQKLFDNMRLRMSTVSNNEAVPKWKTGNSTVSLVSINSRTSHLLTSLLSTESSSSRLKRIEQINSHLKKYPEAMSYAVKNGLVRILLSFRKEASNQETKEILRETLAILGHCDPPLTSGIRILSIDGGGMRGIAVIKMLNQLEMMTGKKIYELFDFICGVSTGAIITCCIVPPLQMSMNKLHELYMDLSQTVFKQNTLWGTSKLVFSRAYYETSVFEEILKQYVGTIPLIETNRHPQCPKICAVSTIVNHMKVFPFLFRNYNHPYLGVSDYLGSSSHTIFEAIRASAAAPTIFEEYRIGDLLHQDGGILVNNPTALAIHEVKSLWPEEKISCIVSCGTGKHNPVPTIQNMEEASKASISWKKIFDKIFDSATDTEAVHTMLNDLLPEDIYHRFNPHLTETIAMDEKREEKIKILEEDTLMYCRRNEDKFSTVAKKLTESRSSINKCLDFVKMQVKLSGYSV